MKRFLFAVAIVALSAAVTLADDQPSVTTTPLTGAPTIVGTTGPTVVSYPTTTTTRRGLFWRLRNRNSGNTYYSAPVMTAPLPAAGATPMPPLSTPQPMPGIKPTGGVMTTPGMVVQATGNLPPGIYTTTDGTVVQIGGMMPMQGMSTMPMQTMSSTQMTTQTTRRGLFSRLRNRY